MKGGSQHSSTSDKESSSSARSTDSDEAKQRRTKRSSNKVAPGGYQADNVESNASDDSSYEFKSTKVNKELDSKANSYKPTPDVHADTTPEYKQPTNSTAGKAYTDADASATTKYDSELKNPAGKEYLEPDRGIAQYDDPVSVPEKQQKQYEPVYDACGKILETNPTTESSSTPQGYEKAKKETEYAKQPDYMSKEGNAPSYEAPSRKEETSTDYSDNDVEKEFDSPQYDQPEKNKAHAGENPHYDATNEEQMHDTRRGTKYATTTDEILSHDDKANRHLPVTKEQSYRAVKTGNANGTASKPNDSVADESPHNENSTKQETPSKHDAAGRPYDTVADESLDYDKPKKKETPSKKQPYDEVKQDNKYDVAGKPYATADNTPDYDNRTKTPETPSKTQPYDTDPQSYEAASTETAYNAPSDVPYTAPGTPDYDIAKKEEAYDAPNKQYDAPNEGNILNPDYKNSSYDTEPKKQETSRKDQSYVDSPAYDKPNNAAENATKEVSNNKAPIENAEYKKPDSKTTTEVYLEYKGDKEKEENMQAYATKKEEYYHESVGPAYSKGVGPRVAPDPDNKPQTITNKTACDHYFKTLNESTKKRREKYLGLDDDGKAVLTPMKKARQALVNSPIMGRLQLLLAVHSVGSLAAGAIAATCLPSCPGVAGGLLGGSVFMMLAAAIGLYGLKRVPSDVQGDDDGLETPGQHLLEVFFHLTWTIETLVLLPFASAALGNLSDLCPDSADTSMLMITSGCSLGVAVISIVTLWNTGRIVTWYEVSQSAAEVSGFCTVAVGVTVCVMGSLASGQLQFMDSGVVSENEAEDFGENSLMWVSLLPIWGLIAASTGVLGFVAAWKENHALLRIHVMFMGIVVVFGGVLVVTVLSLTTSETIVGSCDNILQLMDDSWFKQTFGCSKYKDLSDAEWGCETDIGTNVVGWEDIQVQRSANGNSSNFGCLVGCLDIDCCTDVRRAVMLFEQVSGTIALWYLIVAVCAMYSDIQLLSETSATDEKCLDHKHSHRLANAGITVVIIGVIAALLSRVAVPNTLATPDRLALCNYIEVLPKTQQPLFSCFNGVQDGPELGIDCGMLACNTACPGPTTIPTIAPSGTSATQFPSTRSTSMPSVEPSSTPSQSPSIVPSASPSSTPNKSPTTTTPSSSPSISPSSQPTHSPSSQPTLSPSIQPSSQPTLSPSSQPTLSPSISPSSQPTLSPSVQPTMSPSTKHPTGGPNRTPSRLPSAAPSHHPSQAPSVSPSVFPSVHPSKTPTALPSKIPTPGPSVVPSTSPSLSPSQAPTITYNVEIKLRWNDPGCITQAPTKKPTTGFLVGGAAETTSPITSATCDKFENLDLEVMFFVGDASVCRVSSAIPRCGSGTHSGDATSATGAEEIVNLTAMLQNTTYVIFVRHNANVFPIEGSGAEISISMNGGTATIFRMPDSGASGAYENTSADVDANKAIIAGPLGKPRSTGAMAARMGCIDAAVAGGPQIKACPKYYESSAGQDDIYCVYPGVVGCVGCKACP